MSRCTFAPYGRSCPNEAMVTVTVPATWGLPPQDYPTCASCLPDWTDGVQATARLIEERER